MVELVKLEIKQLPAMRVVGKTIRPELGANENPIPAFWEKCFGDGTFTTLDGMADNHLDISYVGWMADWTAGDGKFTYICGMLMKEDTPLPDGFESRDVPASTVAVGWIRGPEKETYPVAHGLTQKALENEGYNVDDAAQWCMELYNCHRFTQPMETLYWITIFHV